MSFTATATDLVDTNPLVACVPPSGSSFPAGTTTVDCTATDAVGNAASAAFTVTVVDATAPVVTLTGAVAVTHEAGAPFTDLGATATDSAGNTGSATRTMTVVDVAAPVLTAPEDLTLEATEAGGVPATDARIVAFLGEAAATDVVDPSLLITNDAPGFFPVASTPVTFTATDAFGNSVSVRASVTVQPFVPDNQVPVCLDAYPSIGQLWPANHRMASFNILGVTDPDGDETTVMVTRILQDEPTNTLGDGNTAIDGSGVGTSAPAVRAERSGTSRVPGNGRVYEIQFDASDPSGASCTGSVILGVPHDQGRGSVPIDDGIRYDSTVAGGGPLLP